LKLLNIQQFFSCLVLDTEDDSSLDFIGDGSSSEGRKTPTLTPRKGILKSPKVNKNEIFLFFIQFILSFLFQDFLPKESEHSVQFSEKLYTIQSIFLSF
jgi:hypothetical protein